MIQGRSDPDIFGEPAQRQQLLKIGMAEADADFLFRRHLHDLFHLRQNFAVLAAQTHTFMLRMASAAPEAIGGESREPDHLEVGILESHANVLGPHPETHPDAAVDFDAIGQLASRDHIVDVPLGQIGRSRADIPVVFEGDRPHAALRRLDGDLDHVLRPMNEIRKSMNVTIDGTLKQLVLDPRINLQHLRVIFEHLIKIILGIELAHPRHA